MHTTDGWVDKYIDKKNNLIIILASSGKDLIATKSKPEQLPEFKEMAKKIKKGSEDEFDPILYGRFGEIISFEQACSYFQNLKDIEFWENADWVSYNGISINDLI